MVAKGQTQEETKHNVTISKLSLFSPHYRRRGVEAMNIDLIQKVGQSEMVN